MRPNRSRGKWRHAQIEPSPASAEAGRLFARFVELIARLRAPGGCPWDREQTHESVKPMTIEEAYEVAHAIDEGDDEELAGELGDLLLQVVFHANIAEERGAFRLKQVIERVSEKMVRRHPHVFGDDYASTSGEVLRNWEAIKAQEREAKGKDDESMLDSVHKGLPAVMEAFQMTTKVSRVGFDWKEADGALVKLDEEVLELREAIAAKTDPARVAEEVGDLLFAAVNVARLTGVDPESALKASNRKFRRRFRHIEDRLRAEGRRPADSTLEEMDRLWDEAKRAERERPAAEALLAVPRRGELGRRPARVKQTVVPRPSPPGSIQTRPPCSSTMRLTSARPTPVPSLSRVQLLEEPEHPLAEGGVDADAVVPHEEDALAGVLPRPDLHTRPRLVPHELDGVVEEVLHDLAEPRRGRPTPWAGRPR